MGETRKAIEYHDQALSISREIGDRRGEGDDLGNLGIAYVRLGEIRKAIEYTIKLWQSAVRSATDEAKETTLATLAWPISDLRRDPESHRISTSKRSQSAVRSATDEGESNDLGNLGLAYSDLGETRKAIEYYEKSLAISREIENRMMKENTSAIWAKPIQI